MSKLNGVSPAAPPTFAPAAAPAPPQRAGFSSRLSMSARPAARASTPAPTKGAEVLRTAIQEAPPPARSDAPSTAAPHGAELSRALTQKAWAKEDQVESAKDAATGGAGEHENPFDTPDAEEMGDLSSTLAQMDQGSANNKMIRVQYRLQREAAKFMFQSNTSKNDHDEHKEKIANIK